MSKSGTRRRYGGRAMKASEFKARCLDTMDEVQARGVEVLITKRGKPVARLVPAEGIMPSPIGFMRGTVVAEGDIVSPDYETWAMDGEK